MRTAGSIIRARRVRSLRSRKCWPIDSSDVKARYQMHATSSSGTC